MGTHAGSLLTTRPEFRRPYATLPQSDSKNEKGAPNHGRSQSPREGAEQNSTWPAPHFGALVQALLLFIKDQKAQVRGFLGSRNLTLARRSIVFGGRCGPPVTLAYLVTLFGFRPPISGGDNTGIMTAVPPMSTICPARIVGFYGGVGG